MSELDLAGLTVTQLFYCLAVLGAAGLAHGMFGFSYAMIATPLLALTMDYRLAIIAAALPLFVMASVFLLANRASLKQERRMAIIIPGVIVGSLIGATIQAAMPPHVALAMLALLLFFNAVLPQLLQRFNWSVPPEKNTRTTMVCSTFAGVTESALNVGAPFMLIYGTVTRLTRIQQLLVLNLCFCVGKAIQIIMMAQVSSTVFSPLLLVLAVLASLGGQYVGNQYAGRLSEAAYRKLLKQFLFVMAGVLLARAIWTSSLGIS